LRGLTWRVNRLEQFLRDEPNWSAPRQELALDMVRFEWAQVVAFDGGAKEPITPDYILDTPSDKLKLGLQPYLTLLELNFEVDDFLIAVRKQDSDVLRSEASNAMNTAPKRQRRPKRARLPKRAKIYLGVHRHDNMLYYKRLDPEAFVILELLGRGRTVEEVCVEAVSQSSRTEIDWPEQIREWFDTWSMLGWFCRAS
jgi:hypothetical protein